MQQRGWVGKPVLRAGRQPALVSCRTSPLSGRPQPPFRPIIPKNRYSDPAHGIIDGAICFAGIETDPEVLLVLEAQRHGDSLAEWHYGFNRVAFAELHVRFDDKVLWTAPRLTTTAPTEAYHLIPIRLGGQ